MIQVASLFFTLASEIRTPVLQDTVIFDSLPGHTFFITPPHVQVAAMTHEEPNSSPHCLAPCNLWQGRTPFLSKPPYIPNSQVIVNRVQTSETGIQLFWWQRSKNFLFWKKMINASLDGGFNPSEKYAQVKLDHFPNFRGWKSKKNIWNHHPQKLQFLPTFPNKTNPM